MILTEELIDSIPKEQHTRLLKIALLRMKAAAEWLDGGDVPLHRISLHMKINSGAFHSAKCDDEKKCPCMVCLKQRVPTKYEVAP